MPEPYDMSKFKQLQAMVKGCEDPLPKWPDYPVEIRGRARNYKDAQDRLEILKTEPYAYTTVNEESAKNESQKDKKSIKIRETVKNEEKLKNKLNAATISFKTSNKKKKSPVSTSKSGPSNKGVDKNNKIKNGSRSRKSFLENDSISDVSANSSQRDTSDDSLNLLLKKNPNRRTKRRKRSPKNNFKKLKTNSDDYDDESDALFSNADFANVTKESEALKNTNKTTRHYTRYLAKELQANSTLTKDQQTEENFNSDPGLSRQKQSINTTMNQSGDGTFDRETITETPLKLSELSSYNQHKILKTSRESARRSNTSEDSVENLLCASSPSPTSLALRQIATRRNKLGLDGNQKKSSQHVSLSDSNTEDYSEKVNDVQDVGLKKLTPPEKPPCKSMVFTEAPIRKLIDRSSVKSDLAVDKDLSGTGIVLKYFKSISKQIGHLNSQIILNTAELKEVKEYVVKQTLKREYSCNESDDCDEVVINGNVHMDNENQRAADIEKKR